MTKNERLEDMLDRYGEVCKRTVAAKVLGVSAPTITQMLKDGRIRTACAGAMVDVRSIAEYVMAPEEKEEAARIERIKQRRGTRWAV